MISIIGAGPVGSYLAYLLSSQGRDVHVYEEHAEIGLPVHCTGIVTSKFEDIIKPDKSFLVNTINRARIYSPDNQFLDLKLGPNYVLDRAKLDQKLAQGAEEADAKFYTSHRFIDYKDGKVVVQHKDKLKKIKSDMVIGADGPLSPVAKSAGLFEGRKFFTGIQARAMLKNDNAVEFYLMPGGFSWIVPESRSIVRIGTLSRANPHDRFQEFLKNKLGEDHKSQTLEYQGGLIPEYNPKIRTSGTGASNVFLVGDAATMVKATTGGGIVQGLSAAEALADAIINRKDYETEWKAKIGKELRLALMMRRLMDEFSEKDYNLLIELMNRKGMTEALENYDRDSMSSLLPRLVLEAAKQPRFLHFARHLFKRNLYI
jgi:digeranylgeranylglycerophospholipid reductase